MVSKRLMKYNPAFLTEKELIDSFVVRHVDLELILEVIRENVTQSNQHILVIGPRGIGKTMLVLRVAAEVRRAEDLRGRWYPLVFAEESYPVTGPGEFWLEALFHLGEQIREQTGDERWGRTYRELRHTYSLGERNDERLRARALAQLMDFADDQGKRILLVVENFNMLLGDQISSDDAWALRHTLLNEPRIMLLATATERFREIDNADKAMFELFKLHNLPHLDEGECRAVWTSITGQEPRDGRMRPIQILTGGNPRLLVIISFFGGRLSLAELMEDLMQLVDDHTEYFKTQLDKMAPIERKVYLALAELWDPVSAREVAKTARLDVSKTSSLLKRLVGRGAVKEITEGARKKSYQVAERMYNIYYLMRRGGSERVRVLVRFMVQFYPPEDLVGVTRRIAEEACGLDPELRRDHYLAYKGILESADQALRERMIDETPRGFFDGADIPGSIKQWFERKEAEEVIPGEPAEPVEEVERLLEQAYALSEKPDQLEEAERLCRKAVDQRPEWFLGWGQLANLLHERLGRYEEAEEAYRKAIELEPDYAWAWAKLGWLLHRGVGRYKEAETAYRKAVELLPKLAEAWAHLGQLLHHELERYDEAEDAYRKAVDSVPSYAWAWGQLADLLFFVLGRYEEGEKAYRRVVEIKPDSAWAWLRLGGVLQMGVGSREEAEAALRKAIELEPNSWYAWNNLGGLLLEQERDEEAEAAFRRAVELEPGSFLAWIGLGHCLGECAQRWEEGERAYRKAIELEPKFPLAWVGLGDLLREHLGRYGEAEMMYRKAMELRPHYTEAWKGLVVLLVEKMERPIEALELARRFVEDAERVNGGMRDAIDLFVGLAAAGHADEALKILRDSPSAGILEPLVVGLRLYVGEDVRVATEILEVGKDVAKRIEGRREKMQAERGTRGKAAQE